MLENDAKKRKNKKEGNGSIHRRLKFLRETKEAQEKLKAIQSQHRKEMEVLDKTKEEIEELETLTFGDDLDEHQTNII